MFKSRKFNFCRSDELQRHIRTHTGMAFCLFLMVQKILGDSLLLVLHLFMAKFFDSVEPTVRPKPRQLVSWDFVTIRRSRMKRFVTEPEPHIERSESRYSKCRPGKIALRIIE